MVRENKCRAQSLPFSPGGLNLQATKKTDPLAIIFKRDGESTACLVKDKTSARHV